MKSCSPARCSGVSWSVVMAAAVSGRSTPPPPSATATSRPSTSSAVDTSPAARLSKRGGRENRPSGGSTTRRPPSSVAHQAVGSRSAGTQKPVEPSPSGPVTRSCSSSYSGRPAARASSTPSRSLPTW